MREIIAPCDVYRDRPNWLSGFFRDNNSCEKRVRLLASVHREALSSVLGPRILGVLQSCARNLLTKSTLTAAMVANELNSIKAFLAANYDRLSLLGYVPSELESDEKELDGNGLLPVELRGLIEKEYFTSQLEWVMVSAGVSVFESSPEHPMRCDSRFVYDLERVMKQTHSFSGFKAKVVDQHFSLLNLCRGSRWRFVGKECQRAETLLQKKMRYWLPEYFQMIDTTWVNARRYIAACIDGYTLADGDARAFAQPPGLVCAKNPRVSADSLFLSKKLFIKISFVQFHLARFATSPPTPLQPNLPAIDSLQIHWSQVAFFMILLMGQNRRIHRKWPRLGDFFTTWAQDFRYKSMLNRSLSPVLDMLATRTTPSTSGAASVDLGNGLILFLVCDDKVWIITRVGDEQAKAKVNELWNHFEDDDGLRQRIRFFSKLRGEQNVPIVLVWVEQEYRPAGFRFADLFVGLTAFSSMPFGVRSPHFKQLLQDLYIGDASCSSLPLCVPFHPAIASRWTHVESLIHLWPCISYLYPKLHQLENSSSAQTSTRTSLSV